MSEKITLGQYAKEIYTDFLKTKVKDLTDVVINKTADIDVVIKEFQAEAWEHAAKAVYHVGMQQAAENLARQLAQGLSEFTPKPSVDIELKAETTSNAD